MMPRKVMIVDDDQGQHVLMRRLFEDAGYEFCEAFDGREALRAIDEEDPDIILLDVMMPYMDGYELCSAIREAGLQTPIIFLTAKGDIVDKRMGFRAGGDDYAVKPFNSEELLLRVEAQLRRSGDAKEGQSDPVPSDNRIVFDELTILLDQYKVLLAGEEVPLSAKEFEVLVLLASHPGRVFTRAQIYEHLWGYTPDPDQNSITMFMHKIREKLKDNSVHPKYIQTVWRVGYRFSS